MAIRILLNTIAHRDRTGLQLYSCRTVAFVKVRVAAGKCRTLLTFFHCRIPTHTHTHRAATVTLPCCDVGGSPSEGSVATRYGYVPYAYTYVGIKHGLTMQFKWKRHLNFCRHNRTTAQSPSSPACANLPLQIFCYRFQNSSHSTTLWLRVILISLPVIIGLII